MALGATLYSQGTNPSLADNARRVADVGATSQVWCIEDAVAHDDVPAAKANVIAQLRRLHEAAADELPLLFVRVRTPAQICEIVEGAGPAAAVLSGFVLPKMAPDVRGERMFAALEEASDQAGRQLWGMPVLEHPELAWRETRDEHLQGLRSLFDAHRESILSLRIGATDLSGLFGLRRDRDTIVWDIAVVRDVLSAVLNTFTRAGDYLCSGAVWEHFHGPDRLLKPVLRETPFVEFGATGLRRKLLRDNADALMHEVLLDRANGFTGKTVIHPTHVGIVNALHAVGLEEYDDALAIAEQHLRGGVTASSAGNKMNEAGPHGLWAEQVIARGQAFGVLAHPGAAIDLLQHCRSAAERTFALAPAGSRGW